MAGRLGAQDLAAVAVGSCFWFLALLLGLGTLMGLNPITAHRVGARHPAHRVRICARVCGCRRRSPRC